MLIRDFAGGLLFWLYQKIISPALHVISGAGHGCRFEPSCSKFTQQAIVRHGVRQGLWLSLRRVLNCHPFSQRPHFDPVPEQALVLSYPCDKGSKPKEFTRWTERHS